MERNPHAKIEEFKLTRCRAQGSTYQPRPQQSSSTASSSTHAHVHHLIVLDTSFDGSKKILHHKLIGGDELTETWEISFIISNHSMLLENLHETFRHETTRRKTGHEEDVNGLKFSQMLLQCGRWVFKREGIALHCNVWSVQVMVVQYLEVCSLKLQLAVPSRCASILAYGNADDWLHW